MSIRAQILDIVDQIDPIDDEELIHKKLAFEWISSGADIFRIQKPDIPRIHLVSYFIPFDLETRHIFLVHHRKANLWLPPGGHVDINEHPQVTARREMEEELAAKANFLTDYPLFLTVTNTLNEAHPHTDVSLWYIVQGNSHEKYSFDNKEFYDAMWFDIKKIPLRQAEPHLQRFLRKIDTVKSV